MSWTASSENPWASSLFLRLARPLGLERSPATTDEFGLRDLIAGLERLEDESELEWTWPSLWDTMVEMATGALLKSFLDRLILHLPENP